MKLRANYLGTDILDPSENSDGNIFGMNHGDQGDWTIDFQGGIAFLRPYGFETYGIEQEEVDNVIEFHLPWET